MTKNAVTYGDIKRRVLNCLEEENGHDGEYLCDKSDYAGICERMPDALNSAYVRMYESLPEGKTKRLCRPICVPRDLQEQFPPENYKFYVLPADFGKLDAIYLSDGGRVLASEAEIYENYLVVPVETVGEATYVMAGYRKKAPVFSLETEDTEEICESPLFIEALCCLTASELCSSGDSAIYARMVYKYKDLCEGFFSADTNKRSRNSFYAAKGRKGGPSLWRTFR